MLADSATSSIHSSYDYIIVGAGPTGLTLAWLLAQEDSIKRILLIERDATIGGCHRVQRDPVTNLFTEHGPRIYSTIYVNVIQILESMGISFYDLFTEYKFSHSSMSQEILSKLTPKEIAKLGIEFIKLVFDPAYGLFTTVATFLEVNDFTKASKDVISRITHLTDGAGPERFTMNELLYGFDHHVFYKFMQPRWPNDIALFPIWQKKLLDTGKIDIWLNSDVKSIISSPTGNINKPSRISGLRVETQVRLVTVNGKNVILAIPPEHATRISGLDTWTTIGRVFSSNPNLDLQNFQNSNCSNASNAVNASKASNSDKSDKTDWVPIRPPVNTNKISKISVARFGELARYDYYLPIVFHWPIPKSSMGIKSVWGFPATDWGIITILLSDYTNFEDPRSKTVITSCISLTNTPSSFTGLTANQTNDPEALMREVYRQVNEVYKGRLPEPYFGTEHMYRSNDQGVGLEKGIMLISPGVSYDTSKSIWVNSDSSFINTPKAGHLPDWENADVAGLYWVGSLNGQSYYNFSSMESAVSNAISFYLSKYRNPNYMVRSPINFSTFLRTLIVFMIIILLFKYFKS